MPEHTVFRRERTMPLTTLDPPHIYRPDRSMKILFAISGCVLIAFGAIFTCLFGRLFALFFTASGASLQADPATRVVMAAVIVGGGLVVLLCAIGGIAQLLKLAKFSVILTADSIRFQSPFGSSTLALDQILCKRARVTTGRFGDSYTVLIPKDEKRRNLAISSDFVFDEVFTNWLATLPDLDAAFSATPEPAAQLR
jgi:hypothetical protein